MAVTITAAEREFFREVSAAAFANPFSPQRLELDRKITGTNLREPNRARTLREAVMSRVARLEQAGKAHLKHYRGDEALVMRNVFLFEIYHGQCDALDGLIADQLKAGDT
jgi:sigma-54 specific flagellar transcriptional regulator A